jgi:hypothetical protein
VPLEMKHFGNSVLWGYTRCPFEYPTKPATEKELGPAPYHKCPNDRPDMKAILDSQKK